MLRQLRFLSCNNGHFLFVLLLRCNFISVLGFVILNPLLESSQITPLQQNLNQQQYRNAPSTQQQIFYHQLGSKQRFENSAKIQNDNLRILLNYLNDDPSIKLIDQTPSIPTAIVNNQGFLSRNEPKNLLMSVTPITNQNFPVSNSRYGTRYTQKAHRTVVQNTQPNLLIQNKNKYNSQVNPNFKFNNANYVNVLQNSLNDAEEQGAGDDEENEDNAENEEGSVDNSDPLRFSKLGKPNEGAKPIVGNPKTEMNKNNANTTPNSSSLDNSVKMNLPFPSISSAQLPKSSNQNAPATLTTGVGNAAASSSSATNSGSYNGKLANGMTRTGIGLGGDIISPQNKMGQVDFGNTNQNGQKPSNIPTQIGTPSQIIPSIVPPHTIISESITPGNNNIQVTSQGNQNQKYNFKLIYFDSRGICEPIRLLFHYAKVPFEDARITRRQWLALKDNTVYGKVPILEVDGKPLTYCHTISRFLARTFGLAGTTSWEQAKVDEISDFHSDVAMDLQPYLYVVAGFHQGDREALRKAIFLPNVEKYFPVYVNLLKQSGSGFFIKNGLTWIDFVISEYMTTIKHFEPAILDKYPALMKFVLKIQSLPEIFDYITNREHQPV